MKSVWVVRHGETEWSRVMRHTGRADLPLTELGRAQAARLAPRLERETFARVLVSPLLRARQTCEIAGFDARAEVWPELAEWDYGAVEGKTEAEFCATTPGWNLWVDGGPGGESVAEFSARVGGVVARILGAGDGNTLVFAHGHMLRVMAARWVGAAPELGRSLSLGPTSLGRLGCSERGQSIELWNDDRHL